MPENKNNNKHFLELANHKPRVSIGMPVYNGEKYLEQAIKSILNQTFTDFELIISDNASTDGTQSICNIYAMKDPRIRYSRNDKNLGGPNNYNKVFKLATGEFFKWAAYDDLLAPEYLDKCIKVLDNDHTIFGCHSKTAKIDQYGNFLGFHNKGLLTRISSPKVHKRFRDLIGLYYITTPFHAVYRRVLFEKSQLHGSYVGADRNLVAELSLMGRIFEIPECLFYWRDHPDSYTSKFYGSNREDSLDRLLAEAAWWSNDSGSYFPHWRTFLEYFNSVNRVKLRLLERILCYGSIMSWFLEEGSRFMLKDLVLFLLQHSHLASQLILRVPIKIKKLLP